MKIPAREYRARARAALGNNIFGGTWLMALLVALIISAITSALSSLIIGLVLYGPLMIGLRNAFVKNARNGGMNLEDGFTGFTAGLANRIVLGLLQNIFIFLWSLLLIVPGIIKSYSYAMAEYISAENPDADWKECLDKSRAMMNGYKWRLFCLDLSFIGWYFVGALVCGVGTLWVIPYHEAARAQFYLDRVGGATVEATAEPTAESAQ